MALIGYARVSTEDQHLEMQLAQLREAGTERIYQEKISGVRTDRPELMALLDYVRDGDIVICCKLDRIARSTRHLLEVVEVLEKKGVAFRVLNINLDTSTPTGKLMLSMLAAIGQFEREMMLERQREGITLAKKAGAYKGRKPTARAKSELVLSLLDQGKTKEAVAKEIGIGIASVYRIQKQHRIGQMTATNRDRM